MEPNVTMKFLFLLTAYLVSFVTAEFEENRCKCLCPAQKQMRDFPATDERFYVDTNVKSDACNASLVVKPVLQGRITDANHTQLLTAEIDKFILRCICKYETRNVTMIKVVVIFVMSVISCLLAYMLFLFCLDTKWRHTHRSAQRGYQEQLNDPDENIFAATSRNASGSLPAADETVNRATDNGEVRARNAAQTSGGVLGRVEAEQSKWMRTVEQQRRSIFTDHTMLN